MTDRAATLYALAAGLVLSDDDDDDAEHAYLAALASKLGLAAPPPAEALTPEAAAALARTLDAGAGDEVIATLLDAAAADATVIFDERSYLYAVAAVFGVGERDVDARITARISRR
jgi:uncharacterized tellurite resistance protein B-like protein